MASSLRVFLDEFEFSFLVLLNFSKRLFVAGAIAIYEEDAMAQSKMEYDAIRLLISTVNALDCFDEEKYTSSSHHSVFSFELELELD